MKRIISLVLALASCLRVSCCASAAVFTPSVRNKCAPAVVELNDAEGNAAVAKLNGIDLEDAVFVPDGFLVVTAIVDAKTSEQIPETSEQALMDVYNGLQDGSITVPFGELDEEKADILVIRDLFDISWTDTDGSDFKNLLEAEEVSLEMTFDIDIAADAKVYVMVYKNDAWKQIKQVSNNGNGTITCVFEHLCPVAVIVEANTEETPVEGAGQKPESDGNAAMVWLGMMAASLAVLAAVLNRRKQKSFWTD